MELRRQWKQMRLTKQIELLSKFLFCTSKSRAQPLATPSVTNMNMELQGSSRRLEPWILIRKSHLSTSKLQKIEKMHKSKIEERP